MDYRWRRWMMIGSVVLAVDPFLTNNSGTWLKYSSTSKWACAFSRQPRHHLYRGKIVEGAAECGYSTVNVSATCQDHLTRDFVGNSRH